MSHGSKKLRSEDKVGFYLSFLCEMLREFLLKCPGLVIIVALGDNVYPQHTYIMHLHKVCCNNTMCGPKKYVAPGPPLSGSSTVVSVISLTAGAALTEQPFAVIAYRWFLFDLSAESTEPRCAAIAYGTK